LRFAIEDLIGAGAIIAGLKGALSPEARIAVSAYEEVRGQLHTVLEQCSSGRELIERGFGEDVRLASMLNCSEVAPVLVGGAYQRGV
jgi:2-phosphosulfolactate phosphatase